MSIHYQWDDVQKTVLRYCFDPHWNWNELHTLVNHTNAEIDQLDHRKDVLVIYDTPEDVQLPNSFISNATNLARLKRHPRAKVVIVIARSPYLQQLLGMTMRVAQTVKMDFLHVVRDEAEASAWIASYQGRTA